MRAFNVVRFRVKAGNEQRFIDEHRKARPAFKGFLAGSLIRTGDQTFCLVGEWRNSQSLGAARPQMIAMLDVFRDLLEDLGGGLGVTDPVSGEVVATIAAPKARTKRPAPIRRKTRRVAARRAAGKRTR
jgi:hypothetical protein